MSLMQRLHRAWDAFWVPPAPPPSPTAPAVTPEAEKQEAVAQTQELQRLRRETDAELALAVGRRQKWD